MSAKGTVLKRVRQAAKQRQRNRHYKSILSTTIKKVMSLKDKKEASAELSKAQKTIDKIASKGVIHKKKAANKKSSISKYLNNLK